VSLLFTRRSQLSKVEANKEVFGENLEAIEWLGVLTRDENVKAAPMDVVGTVWHVFDITEEGIKPVNEFYNATSAIGVK